MSRPLAQLLPPDVPAGAATSPQFGTSGPQAGPLTSMTNLKSLLQLPIKADPRVLKDCCEMKDKDKPVDSDEDSMGVGGASGGVGGGAPVRSSSQSAFLGPLLWERTLPCDGGLFQLQYMDLEEFLTENGMGMHGTGPSSASAQIPSQVKFSICGSQSEFPGPPSSPPPCSSSSSSMSSSSSSSSLIGLETVQPQPQPPQPQGGPAVPQDASPSSTCPPGPPGPPAAGANGSSDLLVNFDPDPADLALSSVPGQEAFDPRRHRFSDEELKPQPMIKKARKMLVPHEQKVLHVPQCFAPSHHINITYSICTHENVAGSSSECRLHRCPL
uniref:D site albumin promoter binding protein a n=1 Tax=Gouania willdenowi TaxID=441366 RepID=A0A8C5DMV4_GOUWI